MFEGIETHFRTIKLRGRIKSCVVCGESPTITELIDYEQFCGAPAADKVSRFLKHLYFYLIQVVIFFHYLWFFENLTLKLLIIAFSVRDNVVLLPPSAHRQLSFAYYFRTEF